VADVISKTLTCRDCGRAFEHASRSNKPKLLCAGCLKESQRKATRECARRKREANRKPAPNTACQDCGTPFLAPRHKTLRCEDCKKAVAREYQRKIRAAHPKAPREFRCVTCGGKIDRKGNSGLPRYCGPCAREAVELSRRRAEAKRRLPRVTHCGYCGDKLPKPRQRSRTRARCFKCSRQRHYAYMKVRTDRRRGFEASCADCGQVFQLKRKGPMGSRCPECFRAWFRGLQNGYSHVRRVRRRAGSHEKFSSAEIFERDGWKCGICRRRISKRLQHPHPRSASLDHVVPLSQGGNHLRSNARAAHLRCNISRGNRGGGEQLALIG
jgi:hypothetical protein